MGPKIPKDLAERVKRYRATAEYFEQRARRSGKHAGNRERLTAEAERYRKLAAQEVEGDLPPRKPPAPRCKTAGR